MTSDRTIGLSEFIDLTGVDEIDGLRIDEVGIWPEEFDPRALHLLTPKERAELQRTPQWHQPGEPLLKWRCGPAELLKLLEWYGLSDLLEDGVGVITEDAHEVDRRKKYDTPGRLEHFARQIGEKWMTAERNSGRNVGVTEIAKYVERELKRLDKRGARGDYWDWETIKKEALPGITGRKANGKK